MVPDDVRPERMHINPTHLSVAMLLGGTMTFEVPRYQRNYAWGADEIAAFLRDLELCRQAREGGKPRDHFFGGVVTARAPVQGSTRQNLQVIDGQQRLATFLVLMVQLKRAMLGLAAELAPNAGQSPAAFLKERAAMLSERYETHKDSINLRIVAVPRLALSVPDQPFLTDLLQGGAPEPHRNSHLRLKHAFDEIGRHLATVVATAADDAAKARMLDLVHDVIEQDWTVIHMAAESRTNAYMLFQVLNDRGVSLTEGELLRASTLEALEPVASAAEMQAVEDNWDAILNGKAVDIRAALQWVYASQVGAWPGRATLLAEFEGALFPMLGAAIPLTRENAITLIEAVSSLRQDFAQLELMVQGDWPCPSHQQVFAWDRDRLRLLIVHLKQKDCMPLLIAAMLLRPIQFSEIVQILERFCFRFAVLVGGPRAEASNVFNKHAVEIRRNPAAYNMGSLVTDLHDLIALHAPDDVFRSRLAAFGYPRSESKKPLKYFLMTLEHYVRWFDDGAKGRPDCRDRVRVFDFENGTIEHIYAENAAQPDPQLQPLLDTLGNVTMLSPAENDAAGAKNFADKKKYLAASTSKLNQEIAAEQDWTVQAIGRRHDRLIEMALRVFAL
ncbi:DUF262 domain-containing HNH endonuclease family protein [Mesorhizobium sp.]|uniref:DUF262 domain-containing protein n=1 Tax=Mesorhizobium sp. TaxID=1871066 RepID=UPI002580B4C9|nr:DUF262 domain-containing HNH endonuclease family protein [Mesorhizobium sp.]